jgi:AraC-like DNA-binding protein
LGQTSQPDQAEQLVQQWSRDLGVNFEFQSVRNLQLKLLGFEISKLRLLMVHFGTPTTGRSPNPPTSWAFSYQCSGSTVVARTGTRFGPGDGSLGEPDKNADATISADSTFLSLMVSKQEMAAACQALNGPDFRATLNFAERAPAGSSAALTLWRIIQRLASAPVYPQRASEHLERSLKEAALFELLLTWPNLGPKDAWETVVLPASTRQARDFIHARIAELPTVADIAGACGVGVRALARGFEKHLGTSPLQYMLELRLQGVREDLLASRHGSTVTEVALHWGFTHLGIFAARYRESFGELPSETLRKAHL